MGSDGITFHCFALSPPEPILMGIPQTERYGATDIDGITCYRSPNEKEHT